MTEPSFPIAPPPELWKQFAAGAYTWKEAVTYAYRAGADQELEACIAWMMQMGYWGEDGRAIPALRAARRPKPPSLKKQALVALSAIALGADDTEEFYQDIETIKAALEQLDD